MATKLEAKQTNSLAVTSTNASESSQVANTSPAQTAEKTAAEKFKAALEALDTERSALVKSAIENLKPGKPFDHAALREINKIETRKNRLIVGRFAALLRKSEPGITPIVHQILEL